MSDCLGLVLQAATGARVGDFKVSSGHKDELVKWQHILGLDFHGMEVMSAGDPPQLDGLARIRK